MLSLNLEKIDLEKLASELEKYENQWIAISDENVIVSSGETYSEALRGAPRRDNIILLKVPSLSASLAP